MQSDLKVTLDSGQGFQLSMVGRLLDEWSNAPSVIIEEAISCEGKRTDSLL